MVLSNFLIIFVSLTFLPDKSYSFCVDLNNTVSAESRSNFDTDERLLVQLRVGSCETTIHGLTSGASAPTVIGRDFTNIEATTPFGNSKCRFLLLTRNLQTLVYNPSANTFKDGPSFVESRINHAAIAVSGGIVLACGGTNSAVQKTCEVYLPSTNEFKEMTPQMIKGRSDHTIHLFNSGNICVIGGVSGQDEHSSMECLVISGTTRWTLQDAKLTHPRSQHSSAVSSSHLFVCGGKSTAASDTCEIFSFDSAGVMTKLQEITLRFKVSMWSLFVSSVGIHILGVNGELFKLIRTGSMVTANSTGMTLNHADSCINSPTLVSGKCSTDDKSNAATADCTEIWDKMSPPPTTQQPTGPEDEDDRDEDEDEDIEESNISRDDRLLIWGIILGCGVAGVTIELVKCYLNRTNL